MTGTPRTRFGSFEILAPLGAGGMGEVYRALDPRLRREVALKLLPKDFAHDPERVARLTREARLLAALSHPNIAAIHGIEEHEEEIALVLELVEGPTLAELLVSGKLPLPKVIRYAGQIAEAVEAAHARGVIHRDLKPANLKITTDGRVKVLDFGIAKALAEEAPAPGGATPGTPSGATTRSGVIIGTPGYMSPEQTTGGVVDRRTDIWAFGCVLFEALTGRRPFEGATVSETMVRVLEHNPDWDSLPREVPPEIERLVSRCLEKDPRRRLQDIGDARVELEDAQAKHSGAPAGKRLPRRWSLRERALWRVAVGGLAVATAAVTLWALRGASAVPTRTLQLDVLLPPGVVLPMDTEHPVLALSPDGSRLAFVGDEHGIRQLYIRDLSSAESRVVVGSEGAASPVFSPTGAWVAFLSGGWIKKVRAEGGAPIRVHATTPSPVSRGFTWLGADTVVIALSPNSGLSRGSLAGDRVRPVSAWEFITDNTKPYAWPNALPGGRSVLFIDNIGERADDARVNVIPLRDRIVRTLVNGGTSARYAPTGHLLFVRNSALFAIGMDPERAVTHGSERLVLDSVVTETHGAAHFAVPAGGTLAYVPGAPTVRELELVWVDRTGRASPLLDRSGEFSFPRLSPDGTRLAIATWSGPNLDVWMLTIGRGTLERLTSHAGEDFGPVWSPDGRRMAFSSEIADDSVAQGPAVAWMSMTDRRPEFLFGVPGVGNWEFPTSWSPDGRWIAFTQDRDDQGSDVVLLPASGSRESVPLVATTATESGAMFSPDGRYVAYVSDASGREEVYVVPFPGPGERLQISTNGGYEPVWSRDGRELFYREGDRLMAVRVVGGPAFRAGTPSVLFEGRFEVSPYGGRAADYDVAPDGRFVMVRRKNISFPRSIRIVFNWPEALMPRSKPGQR